MQTLHSRLRAPFALVGVTVALFALLFGPFALAASPGNQRPPTPSTERDLADLDASLESLALQSGPVHLMLELYDQPAVLTYLDVGRRPGGTEAAAIQAGQAQAAQIAQAQRRTVAALGAALPAADVLYQVRNTYNGIALVTDAASISQLRRVPGVKAIHRLVLHEPMHNGSQPLIGTPEAWQSFGFTGAGIKIGIIDTGIDYVHTMFGGSGDSADQDAALDPANNVPIAGPGAVPAGYAVTNAADEQLYPSLKVVGGFDFAGDDYNAGGSAEQRTPKPDANPLDCPSVFGGGHGSHVAGTAGGYGVNADGSAYTGPWDDTTPFDTLSIGPGVAPQAQLYALRVFGCGGTTALTTLAIDWSVDPNGDGDFSDRLDVINMSLGAAYGSPDDASAVASDNAAQAGVIVVASAGNSGDIFTISGSPGSAVRTITVASSVDELSIVDGFNVNSPAAISGVKPATFSINYTWDGSAPVTADLIYGPNGNTTGCTAFAPGSVTGRVVLVDWAEAGSSTSPCGSVVRADNAAAAGAVGIIMASGQPFFDASISGNAAIPAVFTTNPVGAELKAALAGATVSITFSNTYRNGGRFVVPGADDTVSLFTSRGPRGRDGVLKPDIAAPGQSIFSADAGTLTAGKSLNGTSMAAPHIAGVMALLRQAYPAWTVEELKALVMNTAGNDLFTGLNRTGTKYAPARVGSGRVDLPDALANRVIAYNAETPGAVSVSFGALEVVGVLTRDRPITIVNKGAADVTYTLGYDARTTIDGVTYSFPEGPTITVPAGASATFTVRLTANAARMNNNRDTTIAATQNGTPRHWLSEAGGLITLTPENGIALRVPVYAVARPGSLMGMTQTEIAVSGATVSGDLELIGTGVSTGLLGPNEHNSLVTALELQGISPQIATPPDGVAASALNADLQYIGATANASTIFFGITTWRDFGTPASDIEFNIWIDTNFDGVNDYVAYNTRLNDSDVFVTQLAQASTFAPVGLEFTNIFSAALPTAAMNNNVIVMPISITALNMPVGSTRIRYYVESYSRFSTMVDTFPAVDVGYLTFDFADLGLDFSAGDPDAIPTFIDMPSNTVPFAYNAANYLANNSLGALLLHHYNTAGTRAEVLPIVPEVAFAAPPANKTYGDAPFNVSAAASTGQAVTYSSTTPAVCTVAGSQVTIAAAGDCVIAAEAVATTNFDSARIETTIPIAKAPLTVTVNDANRRVGAPNPAFSVTYAGFVLDETAAVLDGTLSFTTAATSASPAGRYAVTAGGLTADNYAITFVEGTLRIEGSLIFLPLLAR